MFVRLFVLVLLLAVQGQAKPVWSFDPALYSVPTSLSGTPGFLVGGSNTSTIWQTWAHPLNGAAVSFGCEPSSWAHAVSGTALADQDLSVDVDISAGNRANLAICVTGVDGVGMLQGGGYQMQLQEGVLYLYKDNYSTLFGSVPFAPADPSKVRLRLMRSAGKVYGYADGVLRLGPYTDSDFTHGLQAVGSYAGPVSYFANMRLDDTTPSPGPSPTRTPNWTATNTRTNTRTSTRTPNWTATVTPTVTRTSTISPTYTIAATPVPMARFEPYSGNPILRPGLPWEADGSARFSVIQDGAILRGIYWAGPYSTHPGGALGMATSTDGLHWERVGAEPILGNGYGGEPLDAERALLVKVGPGTEFPIPGPVEYRIYYQQGENPSGIALATSSDGVHFSAQGVVIPYDIAGPTDVSFGWNSPSPYFDGTYWYLTAQGACNGGCDALFRSADGKTGFTYMGELQGLRQGSGGYHGRSALIPRTGALNGQVQLFYAARFEDSNLLQIYHALAADSSLLHYIKDPVPVLTLSQVLSTGGFDMPLPEGATVDSVVEFQGKVFLYMTVYDNAYSVHRLGVAVFNGTLLDLFTAAALSPTVPPTPGPVLSATATLTPSPVLSPTVTLTPTAEPAPCYVNACPGANGALYHEDWNGKASSSHPSGWAAAGLGTGAVNVDAGTGNESYLLTPNGGDWIGTQKLSLSVNNTDFEAMVSTGSRGVLLARIEGGLNASGFCDHCYLFQVIPGGTSGIYRVLNGVIDASTTLDEEDLGLSCGRFKMRLRVYDEAGVVKLKAYLNDGATPVLEGQSSAGYGATGSIGMMALGSPTRYDDLKVNASQCGLSTPTPTPSPSPVLSPSRTATPCPPTPEPKDRWSRRDGWHFGHGGRPIFGPNPLRRGQSLRIFFGKRPLFSRATVYDLNGEPVFSRAWGPDQEPSWSPPRGAQGLYIVHVLVHYEDGRKEESRFKAAVLP